MTKGRGRGLMKYSETSGMLFDLVDEFFTRGYRPVLVSKVGMEGIWRMRDARAEQAKKEALRRLRKQQLIKLNRIGNKFQLALTEKGIFEALRLRVLKSDLFENDDVCMVVFDIPERKRRLRQELRRFLSSAGFLPIQPSVWISPFDAGVPLAELFDFVEANGWVRIYRAHLEEVRSKKMRSDRK